MKPLATVLCVLTLSSALMAQSTKFSHEDLLGNWRGVRYTYGEKLDFIYIFDADSTLGIRAPAVNPMPVFDYSWQYLYPRINFLYKNEVISIANIKWKNKDEFVLTIVESVDSTARDQKIRFTRHLKDEICHFCHDTKWVPCTLCRGIGSYSEHVRDVNAYGGAMETVPVMVLKRCTCMRGKRPCLHCNPGKEEKSKAFALPSNIHR